MSRTAGLTALKKNRDIVQQALVSAVKKCQEIINNQVDDDGYPRSAELRMSKRLLKTTDS